MGSFFFYQGSGIKILGEMGLRDQNNGKEIGINGSPIYHVTTLLLIPILQHLDMNAIVLGKHVRRTSFIKPKPSSLWE